MKLFKLLIFLTLTLTFTGSVFAQSATDSANPLRDSVKQKVAEELAQIKQAVSKKAFLGSVTTKNDASLTLTTWGNQSRNLLVSTDSVIKLLNNRDGTSADLKVGDYVLAMGNADSQNTLTVSRLLVVKTPGQDTRQIYFGTVTKKTISSLTISTTKNETLDIKLSSATKYTGSAKSADIKTGSKILVLTKSDAALVIHLFP
jgi:hypothetical protein